MTNLIPPSDTNTVSVTFSVRTPAEPVMPNKEQIESFITEKQKKSTSAHISEPPTDVTEQVKSVNSKNLYEREKLCIACSDLFYKSERTHAAAPPFQTANAYTGLRFKRTGWIEN